MIFIHLDSVTQNLFLMELETGEIKYDTWTVNYIPPQGGKYNGKLTVTNNRIIFIPMMDISWKGLAGGSMYEYGAKGELIISKKNIGRVDVSKSFISKKVMVTLTNGDVHQIDYGMLSVEKIYDAINNKS